MPTFARLNADLTEVLCTAELDSAPDSYWRPVVGPDAPSYDPEDEVLTPSYVVLSFPPGADVVRNWVVTTLTDSIPTPIAVQNRFAKYDGAQYEFMLRPSGGSSDPTVLGGSVTVSGTVSYQVVASSTNRHNGLARKRFSTSNTAGSNAGFFTPYKQWYRSLTRTYGGFLFRARFGMQANLNGGQKFVGLCASTVALAGEPSALLNCCGMGYDSTDASTGNWFFIRNNGSGSANKVDLGADAARVGGDGYELMMLAPSGGGRLFVCIKNITTGAFVLRDIFSAKIPIPETLLAFKAEARNGAVAAVDSIDIADVSITSLQSIM